MIVTQLQQINKMKQALYDDLNKALDMQKTHIGESLSETDVIGVIEKVKFDYMFISAMEDYES